MVNVLLWQKLQPAMSPRAPAERLRVVLDNKEVVLLCKRVDPVHIAHIAVKMHRHDRLGAFVNQLLGGLDADAVVIEIDVGEPRDRAGLHD